MHSRPWRASNRAIVELIAGLNDARFKHFASDTVFTMTDNWEAALGHAAGEYVAFMGSPACAD
jgi:hypothetical protein